MLPHPPCVVQTDPAVNPVGSTEEPPCALSAAQRLLSQGRVVAHYGPHVIRALPGLGCVYYFCAWRDNAGRIRVLVETEYRRVLRRVVSEPCDAWALLTSATFEGVRRG